MFGRKSKDDGAAVKAHEPVEEPVEATRSPQDKKGRPTPKRSEAEAARIKAIRVPKTRKEAAVQRRERMRAERIRQREALMRGDERALPPRDRGPLRRFTRDYVDVRTCVAEFFLPFAVVILVFSMIRNPQIQSISLLVWMLLIVAIVADSIRICVGLRRTLRTRFPDDVHKGLRRYALMRSLQMRRLRLPKPQVKRRETI